MSGSGFVGAATEVTRSSATVASTASAVAAGVALVALGAIWTLAWRRDERSVAALAVTAVAAVATVAELGWYLAEQVRLTLDDVTAVAGSTRSVVTVARLVVLGLVTVVLRQRRAETPLLSAATTRATLVGLGLAAAATAVLDPVAPQAGVGLAAVAAGALAATVGTVAVRRRGAVAIDLAGVGAAAVVGAVVLAGASGASGWSARAETATGAFDVSVVPASPDELNEIHVIGQPGADGRLPRLAEVTVASPAILGPDPGAVQGEGFPLFLAGPDHAIAYGVELDGGGPWSVEVGFATPDGTRDVVVLEVDAQ